MQIKFVTIASIVCLATFANAAPSQAVQGDSITLTNYAADSIALDSNEALSPNTAGSEEEKFNKIVEEIKKDPGVQNILDFLVQTVAALLDKSNKDQALVN
ncbi:uncharacterized protein B0P05DRAFT_584183 [Gilbertella persicaria]|uniref:uncharacterized protein n=1 Tax=Gilbertella persicaria TaxID=101096 RepID=UPI00221E452E|nr:uncharacterized protein B0P05DRAFT_584183 [Gilbertella persicaria]KAI8091062.1 hypothetical protein B0P05DRAFT_584183 [Gilbertella persicaria]